MNMQETSLDAYRDKVLPRLSKKQGVVFAFLKQWFGNNYTNMEIAQALGWSINRVTPRVLELRRMGEVVLATRRKCNVTGNRAMSWRAK